MENIIDIYRKFFFVPKKLFFPKLHFMCLWGLVEKLGRGNDNLTWVEVPKYDTEDDHTISF